MRSYLYYSQVFQIETEDAYISIYVTGIRKQNADYVYHLRKPQQRKFFKPYYMLRNPKQQRGSKKSSDVADSASNLMLACRGIHLQFTLSIVWARNAVRRNFFSQSAQKVLHRKEMKTSQLKVVTRKFKVCLFTKTAKLGKINFTR